MKYLALYTVLFLVLNGAAHAQDVPVPKSKIETLKAYEKQLREQGSSFDKHGMRNKLGALEENLEDTRAALVELAASMQSNEKTLSALEERINKLQANKAELAEVLQNDQTAMSKLLLALERIRRVPPQALIARPEAPLKAAQSAMLLGEIIPALNEKANKLKENIARQNAIAEELEQKRAEALERKQNLEAEEIKLSQLAKERENIYKATQKDYKVKEIEAQQISNRSRNVGELVSKLEDNKRRQQTRDAVKQAVLSSPPVSMPPAGAARMPISGIIKVRYNDLDKFGAKSEGIRIEGRSGGLVIAPMAGIIRFAGPFKNYDNMVIIEHENGYHSLVAGLEKVDTLVGQKITAGEPIGKLKSTSGTEKPTLYYELRYKGGTVDPAKKLTDLG